NKLARQINNQRRKDADAAATAAARAAAGGTGVTAAAALERLVSFQKERVGVEKVSAVKPLRRAMNLVVAAEGDLAATVSRHDEYRELARSAVAGRGRVDEAQQAVYVAEAALAAGRRDGLVHQLQRLEALAAEFPGGEPEASAQTPTAEIARIVERYQALPARPQAEGPSARALQDELDNLPEVPVGPVEVPAAATDAVVRYRAALDEMGRPQELATPPGPDVEPTEVQAWVAPLRADAPESVADLEARLDEAQRHQVSQAIAATRRRRVALAGWAALLIGTLAGAAGSGPLRVAGLVVAVGAVFALARVLRTDEVPVAVTPDALCAELDELREHHVQYRTAREQALRLLETAQLPVDPDDAVATAIERRALRREMAAAGQRRADAEARAAGARAEAIGVLADHGVDTADPVAGLVELRRCCSANREQRLAADRRPIVVEQLRRRLAHDAEVVRHDQVVADVIAQVVDAARSHGVGTSGSDAEHNKPGDVQRLITGLEELLGRWTNDGAAQRRRHERWGRFQAALDGHPLEDHQELVRRAVEEADQALDRASGEVSRAADPQAAHRAAVAALAAAREDADLTAGRLAQIDPDTVDVGSAEARLAAATEELADV
ncbi:MAG: hypothetical protein P8N02_20305, partial [Actinomycetota bacterium]|nr:hypothetical protein [Actinomycetota bacterium]